MQSTILNRALRRHAHIVFVDEAGFMLTPILRRTWLLERATGLKRREDTSVRGHGPGPAWLEEYRWQPV
jgi:hypothetical protein